MPTKGVLVPSKNEHAVDGASGEKKPLSSTLYYTSGEICKSIHAIERRLPVRKEGLLRHPPARLLLAKAKVQVDGRAQASVVQVGARKGDRLEGIEPIGRTG